MLLPTLAANTVVVAVVVLVVVRASKRPRRRSPLADARWTKRPSPSTAWQSGVRAATLTALTVLRAPTLPRLIAVSWLSS